MASRVRTDSSVGVDPRTVAFRKARAAKLFASQSGTAVSEGLQWPGDDAASDGGAEPRRRIQQVLTLGQSFV